MRKPYPRPVSARRRARQSGQEIIEFGLVTLLYVPLLLGTFVTGMNLIRNIEVTHVCRDLGNMYIHGADFSTWAMQNQAARLAVGLGLNVGSSFAGNQNTNNTATGRGVVIVSQVTFVGTPSCTAALPASCTNQNQYVFTQRIVFGNAGLRTSNYGSPTGAVINSAGVVQNPVTDFAARATNFSTNLQTQLNDGQFIYIVEVYFDSPDLAVSSLSPGGVYSRVFF